MTTAAITPSNEELAELEAEMDIMRREAFDAWVGTLDGPISLDDEF